MSVRELYQEMIVDHARHPRNFDHPLLCTHEKEGHNPLCGDHLYLKIQIEHDCIHDISFTGSGCAIFMASSSLMTESVKGKTIASAVHLFERMHALLTEHKEHDDLGKLAIFSGVHEFPVRVKCASLPWHTLHAILISDSNYITTEE